MSNVKALEFLEKRYNFYLNRMLDNEFSSNTQLVLFLRDRCDHYYNRMCELYPLEQLMKDCGIDHLFPNNSTPQS